jgi:hypothetical protein
MPRKWLILFLIACAAVFIVWYVYGLVGMVYPLCITLSFLGVFSLTTLSAVIQAYFTPGLERLDKPNFWFSSVYNAWYYVTDREVWAAYAVGGSCLAGASLGSVYGLSPLLHWYASYPTYIASWLSGMLLMISIAIPIGTWEHWSKTEEPDSSYAE